MAALRKFNRLVLVIVKVILICLVAGIAISVFVSVATRNLLNYSITWAMEANQVLFMWTCLLGLVAIHSLGTMLRFELLEWRFPASFRPKWRRCLSVLELALALLMVWAGWEMIDFAGSQRFSTMPLTYAWMYAPVPVAGALVAFKALENVLSPTAAKGGE